MTAAGDEKECDDKDPDPVIVKETAKTVVIHKISSLIVCVLVENGVLTIIICRRMWKVTEKSRILLNKKYCKKIGKPLAKTEILW